MTIDGRQWVDDDDDPNNILKSWKEVFYPRQKSQLKELKYPNVADQWLNVFSRLDTGREIVSKHTYSKKQDLKKEEFCINNFDSFNRWIQGN